MITLACDELSQVINVLANGGLSEGQLAGRQAGRRAKREQAQS